MFKSLLVIAMLAVTPVWGDVFLGARVARMDVAKPAEDATNLGLLLSRDLDVFYADFGIVAEITRTAKEGETRDGRDLQIETNALYVKVKTPGTIYVNLRGGIMQERLKTGSSTDSEHAFSWGGGLGANVGKTRIELNFTEGGARVDYLSIDVQFLIAGARR